MESALSLITASGLRRILVASLLDHVSAIAHRGGSKLRPENTMAAFDHAVTLGVDALECDVHLSRDGEVVVIHDPTLDRTTDGRAGLGLTAAELAASMPGFTSVPVTAGRSAAWHLRATP